MQVDTHVPNARMPVSKVPDVRAILVLQDVRAGCAVNACKTCGHVATVPDDATGRSHATDRVQCGRQQDKAHPMTLKISFATPSH
jgi:hypothetical protein